MTIMVTGGAGYIGSHTCVELIKSRYTIVIFDNFSNSQPEVLERIKRITGVEVREATAAIETINGIVMQTFASGTVVQVFLLARSVPGETWSGTGPGNPSG